MSTYIGEAINPKTNKVQKALFYDDFYGQHYYGIGFREDGEDATDERDLFPDTIILEDYVFYPIDQIEALEDLG
ncbi:hypothetical protein FWC31_01230 [Candidatus Saccharibacteria bacterium]|nr:hypothetical protein [Candidatus Saccharibacteria bacterium]